MITSYRLGPSLILFDWSDYQSLEAILLIIQGHRGWDCSCRFWCCCLDANLSGSACATVTSCTHTLRYMEVRWHFYRCLVLRRIPGSRLLLSLFYSLQGRWCLLLPCLRVLFLMQCNYWATRKWQVVSSVRIISLSGDSPTCALTRP